MSDELNEVLAGLTRVGEADFSNRMMERALAHAHLVPAGMARERLTKTAHLSIPVVVADAARYRPPPHLAKMASEEQLVELAEIMGEVKRINDEHAGELDHAVFGLLNGDPEVVALQDRLVRWTDDFAARRLARRNPRDDDDPVARFDRILPDLRTWLSGLAAIGANSLVMGLACKHFTWRVYRGTWGQHIRIKRTWDRVEISWGGLAPAFRKYCADWMTGTGWTGEQDLALVCNALGADADGNRVDELRARVRELASEILETRPFLVHRFKPERTITEVAIPGGSLWVAWAWAHAHHLGMIWLGRTRRDLEEDLHNGLARTSVAIALDGRMAIPSMLWITLDDPGDLPTGWSTNLVLLAAVHPILRGFHDRIDFQSLLAKRWRAPSTPTATEPVPADEDDEVLAASCEVLARGDDTPRGGALRAEHVFKVLAELGCEMRQGKGSEVVVSRPGYRMFTLGHHGKNPEIGWVTVRRLLSRLGLSVGQWIEVAHR